KVAVVDGNVYRVLARVFGIEKDINSLAGKKEFAETAAQLISEKQPDTYNQAIMEFGALHCTPANPNCLFCPFNQTCVARLTQKQNLLPVKSKKVKQKKRYFYYIVLEQEKKLFMRLRPEGDIWQGLFDFPLIESKEPLPEVSVIEKIDENNTKNLQIESISKEFKHILTHQVIFSRFYFIKTTKLNDFNSFLVDYKGKLHALHEIEDLPKPVLVSRYLKEYNF
ncbi:MAG: NUDIX domain-containing protein, partial [Bacteroidota bacterium]